MRLAQKIGKISPNREARRKEKSCLPKFVPFTFQRHGAKWLLNQDGRGLIADDMGLGKTYQVIMFLKIRIAKVKKACVICPASLKFVWERAAQHLKLTTLVIESSKQRLPAEPPQLTIINYDLLSKRKRAPKGQKPPVAKKKQKPKPIPSNHFRWIESQKMGLFVLDECHYLQSQESIRTILTTRLVKSCRRIIGVTGTPIANRPKDFYPILHILWPKEFPSWLPYATRYCGPKLTRYGWTYNGATRINELHKRLVKCGFLRRLKRNVLKDLKDKIREVVPLPITKKKEYEKALNNFIAWLAERKGAVKAKKAAKAAALTKVGYLKRLAAECALPEKLKWIDQFLVDNPDKKIVLFAIHKSVIAAIQERYGRRCVAIDGSVPTKKRSAIVDRFQNDKRVRVFAGQLRAAAEGLTLTAASDLAFVEIGWTPGSHTQAEDRIHRIGQTAIAKIHYLIGAGTIEENLCRILQEKQKVISRLLDSGKGEHLMIYEALIGSLERSAKPRRTKTPTTKRSVT